jgi:hypothetical protein
VPSVIVECSWKLCLEPLDETLVIHSTQRSSTKENKHPAKFQNVTRAYKAPIPVLKGLLIGVKWP